MKKKSKKNNERFHVSNLVIIVTFLLFLVLIARLSYLCIADYKVGDSTITAFIKNRNTKEEVIMPTRGTIFDTNGNILANDVTSYTLIAYLSDKRVDAQGKKSYIEDIDTTAKKLAPLLKAPEEEIKDILTRGKENGKYQVELGKYGRGLTELTKSEIDKLSLQGIDFEKEIKRYYPNGDFASYLLGYTVFKDDDEGNSWITGEMGIEEYYDKELKGKAGYVTYEKDKYGYRIANGREYVSPSDDGNDIYLTIDNNIELFTHDVVKKAAEDSEAEWVLLVVADAKTGAILGYSSTPSFDPNLRNMTSYIDPLTGLAYEPGSTMKIFSYMCAIDSGKYNGNDTYESGTKTYTSENDGSTVTISDWNKEGWGTLSYDKGFALSSNIAVANIVEKVITKEELKACYEKYGFGKKTGFPLAREEAGSIDYRYQIEAATAGYGQGIMTTPIQHIKALTAIANDGVMLEPYVVSKIVDTDTKKTTYEGKRTEVLRIANHETITKIKSLMASVINGNSENSTGSSYHMDGYSLIGKTGTAQIFDYKRGAYMPGDTDYIYSFSGLFPEENPEIIVYAALRRPKDTTNYISPMIREVEKDITKYLNIADSTKEKASYQVESFYNKDTNTVKEKLSNHHLKVLTIGDGKKIIAQYPQENSTIYEDDLVILKTNSNNIKMPNLVGYSRKEAINILKLMNVKYKIEGTGYVTSQSLPEGETVNGEVTISLTEKYLE